jgi:hypothetical protein
MDPLWNVLPEFPQFKDLSHEEKPVLDETFHRFPPVISELTFTDLFVWGQAYRIRIGLLQDFVCLMVGEGRRFFFLSSH